MTGGASGVGKALVKLLYQKDATIYIAGRSESNGLEAIRAIEQAAPLSNGRLEFLPLDLSDLSGIRQSAEAFMAKESRLDVLWNNAGTALFQLCQRSISADSRKQG